MVDQYRSSTDFDYSKFNSEMHGRSCWVAGWGKDNTKENRKELHSVGLNFMSIEYCRKHSMYEDGKDPGPKLKNDEICAGLPDSYVTKKNAAGFHVPRAGKNSCQNDLGGPLVCDVDGKLIFIGVVSWRSGCTKEGYPGIYSSVHYHQEWIREVIGKI